MMGRNVRYDLHVCMYACTYAFMYAYIHASVIVCMHVAYGDAKQRGAMLCKSVAVYVVCKVLYECNVRM